MAVIERVICAALGMVFAVLFAANIMLNHSSGANILVPLSVVMAIACFYGALKE